MHRIPEPNTVPLCDKLRRQEGVAMLRPLTDTPVSSLFLFHLGSNEGYAMAPLERLFYETALCLAHGDASRVHFAYTELSRGHARMLPPDFANVFQFDYADRARHNLERGASYVRRNGIELVVIFDIAPLHPLFAALRRAGARSIVAYQGAGCVVPMPLWRLIAKQVRFKLSHSKVDGMIYEAKAMADVGVDVAGIPASLVDIVPLGVDTSVFQPGASQHVYELFGFPRTRKVVVYAGHMEHRKGVHSLVEAAIELLVKRRRLDVCFAILGNRPAENEQYERMYAGMGIEDLIRFGGYRSDLAEIYRGCFCGVLPSTGWDSFTYTSLEMAASGLPVIAARTGGLPEAVLHRQTGIIYDAGDAQQLADRIEELLDDPDLAAGYGTRGRLRCEHEFSFEAQRLRLLDVLWKRMIAKAK
jgi:glycosyltransferase involved in cell wall biosynthesis